MERAKNEYETLRAVDPGAAVEGHAAAPQPSHLRVAPLVGGQWSVPEGRPYEDREADRGEAAEKWGPPRQELDARTLVLAGVALLAALSLAVWQLGLGLTAELYLLVLVAPALVLRRARRYLLDFIPFGALLLLYAQSRGIAHLLQPHPYYLPQLKADKFLFGGYVPSEQLQDWLSTGTQQWYDSVVLAVMKLHFIVPPLLGFVLWVKRRALFYRFATTILTLSFAGALTFYLYPSAPPWAAAERGLLPGLIRIPPDPASSPAGALGNHSLSITQLIDPNPYAAIPSLHAGYAFLCFLFAATLAWKTRWRWWALALGAIYPLAQSFAVVYTGNHYVIDLVIGYVYAAAALGGVWAFWRHRRLPE
jgi:membrane-associated phospholipid phosphatase